MNRNERHDIPIITSSRSDWVWLRDALDLAAVALGSRALAKERLTEWLAAGKLPWSCMSWEGLDAAGIAKLRQELRAAGIMSVAAWAAYHNGDPQFWGTSLVEIDWGDNAAYETVFVSDGARAGESRCRGRTSLHCCPWATRAQAVARRWRVGRRRGQPHEGGQRDSAGHSNHRFCTRARKANGQGRHQQPIHPSNQIEKHREKAPRLGALANYLHQIAEAHSGAQMCVWHMTYCETGTARKREGTAALGAEEGRSGRQRGELLEHGEPWRANLTYYRHSGPSSISNGPMT